MGGVEVTDFYHPAYVAGIIDGEGSVYARRLNPHISVGNTYEPLIAGLSRIGGYVQHRSKPSSLGSLVMHDWVISGESAVVILTACVPYMTIKRQKALDVMAEYRGITGSNHAHFARVAREKMPPEWLAWEQEALTRG